MIILIAGFLFILASIFVGIYLLCHKRKVVGDPIAIRAEQISKLDISESAKEVHLKELKRETEKKFTKKWFLEYWQGKRSAFYAWFTWIFVGNIITGLIFGSVTLILIKTSFQESWVMLVLILLTGLYFYIGTMILWRCANNSTTTFKYFVRFISILNLFRIVRFFI